MKKLIAVILALVFVLSLSACGAEEPASDLDYVKENGKLVVEDVKGYRKGDAYQLFKLKQKITK